jgi:hypothetical protein
LAGASSEIVFGGSFTIQSYVGDALAQTDLFWDQGLSNRFTFQSNWTGYFESNNAINSLAAWQTSLLNGPGKVFVDSTEITNGNFASYFKTVDDGDLMLIPVPEPSSLSLLLFGSAMFWVVGRKRR